MLGSTSSIPACATRPWSSGLTTSTPAHQKIYAQMIAMRRGGRIDAMLLAESEGGRRIQAVGAAYLAEISQSVPVARMPCTTPRSCAGHAPLADPRQHRDPARRLRPHARSREMPSRAEDISPCDQRAPTGWPTCTTCWSRPSSRSIAGWNTAGPPVPTVRRPGQPDRQAARVGAGDPRRAS